MSLVYGYTKMMIFEMSSNKSAVQIAVEDLLAKPAARGDVEARRSRAKAAMVLEVAEVGYSAAKIAVVARRAKISTASIYRDFGDRETLLLESLELVIGLFAQNWVVATIEIDPVRRIEALLLAHGRALSDPFMGWIFRLYVHLANTTAPYLLPLAHAARDGNLAFWLNEISSLEAQGTLVKTNCEIVVAIVLGAIERRTILSRMAFGENDEHEPRLEHVAAHTALALFQVFGTRDFWAKRSDKPAPGWLGDDLPQHGLDQDKPVVLLDLPSRRLKAYGERVLSRDVNRLDAEGRKVRVQLAAMIECNEFGYEASTMASVAARAGVSTATFYADYPDKRALFSDAMLMQARFRVDYKSLIDNAAPRSHMIASLLYSIVYVLADPDFLWFHRVSMASEISDMPNLVQASRETRAFTEGFWFDHLSSLEGEGYVQPNDQALTMNLLLGATQRRSVLSMVFFGKDDVSDENMSQLALASTDFVLRLVGAHKSL